MFLPSPYLKFYNFKEWILNLLARYVLLKSLLNKKAIPLKILKAQILVI
jgi:hypothetical protein